jgi:nucleotide-binding universal stress UspA family protein
MNLRSIISPVDFSEQSRHALRWAGAFVEHFHSRLTVLTVVDPLLAEAARIRLSQDLAKAETEPALHEFIGATWPAGSGPSTQIAVKTPIGDSAASVILDAAHSEGADLIVMGTHGLGGARKWLLGSTTERLLRRTDVPVLVVPPPGSDSVIARAGETLELSSILAATDFSEPSIVAITTAVDLASQFSATTVLTHVVEPPTVPQQWRSLLEKSDDTRVAEARARLKALADEYCGAQRCEAVVSGGRPADVIGSLAQDRQAQLIVMGLNSDQGRFAARPGSIAYRVVSSATVPVLVVPGPGK